MKEGSEVIEQDMEDGVKDAALIAAAQRVEHYEMAGYGCVRTYASLLGATKAAALLEKTLEQEKEAEQSAWKDRRGNQCGNSLQSKIEAGSLIRGSWRHGERCFRYLRTLFSRWCAATGFSIQVYRVSRIVIHCAAI